MSIPKLKVITREIKGKKSSQRVRKEGFVPGIVYGHNKETKSIKIDRKELQKLLNKHGESGTVNIELEGQIRPTIIKEVQRGVAQSDVLHIDFQELSVGEKIKMAVHINVIGKEKVETPWAIIQQQLNELDIQCLPKHIPQRITVNVSELEIGNSLTVGDLDIFKDTDIEVLNDTGEVVVSLTAIKKESEPEEEDNIPIYESETSILDK